MKVLLELEVEILPEELSLEESIQNLVAQLQESVQPTIRVNDEDIPVHVMQVHLFNKPNE